MSLNGKRLLVLGGQQKLCDIIEKARSLGIYTVVTDWYENSPAKNIADESASVSTSDVDGLLDLIANKHIDGVFTGFIDSTLPYYRTLCERARLPCYLGHEALLACTDKRNFKKACRESGIKTIPEFSADEVTDFPVLVKPADSSGSKGITVCCDRISLEKATARAERFSRSGSYIIEKFMSCDYVAAYYTVYKGEAVLSMLSDKDMNRMGRGNVPFPTAFVSPSRYYEKYISEVDSRVKNLARNLKLESGTFLISFFVNGSEFYAVELSARLTATREYLFIEDAAGINTLEMYLNHALTGNFEPLNGVWHDNLCERVNEYYYIMLFSFLKEGIIGKAEGFDRIKRMNCVLDVLQLREVGAKIRADGSYSQLLSRIYVKSEDACSAIDYVEYILNALDIYDTKGMPMLMAGFDIRSFFRDI